MFIDPAKENCPRTLEEISYIEPQEYRAKMVDEKVQSNYLYDEKTGFYTWIIRYKPDVAIIFDWRFTANGPDFKEFVPVDYWKNRIAADQVPDWIDESLLQFPEWQWF